MTDDGLKLTAYFGERDRVPGGGFLADALTSVYAELELRTSLLLRGSEGFGWRHHLNTDRLLTLSEDLPLVSVAVDDPERIHTAWQRVTELSFGGLVTLERARLLSDRALAGPLAAQSPDALKLTVYVGRHHRVDGRPAHELVVADLHRAGMTGATVLLGIDGTAHGARRRARFFAANADVPVMAIAVGDSDAAARALATLTARLERPLITLERIQVCKRDGRKLAEPQPPDAAELSPPGLASGVWQKLMIHTREQARAGGEPLHQRLLRELRRAGAAGTTTLRGIWGYHAAEPPHGDSFWQLRRRVPLVTVIVDTPERIRRWFALIDELTAESGLVTCEAVPAVLVRR